MSDDEFHSADEESGALSSVEKSSEKRTRRDETTMKSARGSSPDPSSSPTEPPTKLAEPGASKAEDEIEVELGGLELGGDGRMGAPAAAAAVTDHWARPINATARRKSAAPLGDARTHHRTEPSGGDSDDDGGGGGGGASNFSSPGRRGSLAEAHDAIRLMQGCLGAPWPSQDEGFSGGLLPLPPSLPPQRSTPPLPPPAPVPQEPPRMAGPPGATRSVGGVTRDAVLARLAAAKATKAATIACDTAATLDVAAPSNTPQAAAAVAASNVAFLPKTTASTVSPDPPPATLSRPQAGSAARVALVRAVDVPK